MPSKRISIVLILFSLVLLMSAPSNAAPPTQPRLSSPNTGDGVTYYIAKNGNDRWSGTLQIPNRDNTDGPWRYLHKIWDQKDMFQPGDMILLRRGDVWAVASVKSHSPIISAYEPYRAFMLLAFSGVPDNPITVGAYGKGAKPVIDGRNYHGTNYSLIIAHTVNYVTIQDLHLIPGERSRRYIRFMTSATDEDVGVSYVKVRRIDFDNSIDIAGRTRGGHGISFDNIIYHNSLPSNAPEPNPGAPIHHIEVSHNRFVGIGGFKDPEKYDAINVGAPKGGHFWIHHNEFLHCNEAIDVAGDAHHLIEYNMIVDTSKFGGIKIHSQYSHVSHSTIRGNVIIGAYAWGIIAENITASRIYNNTIFTTLYSPQGGGYGGMMLGDADHDRPLTYYGTFKNNEIMNNIVWGGLDIQGALPNTNIHTVNRFSHNIYYYPDGNEIETVKGETRTISVNATNFEKDWILKLGVKGDRLTDPQFVNPRYDSWWDYGDFHLKPGSPALNSGAFVDMTKGINGNFVPNGARPNIGAYQ